MWQYFIPAVASGLGSYFGSKAKKRVEEIYRQQLAGLEEQQDLERQALIEQLGYETGLARRKTGWSAAARGITGTATYGQLQDIEDARSNALRKLYWQHLLERKRLASGQDIRRKEIGIENLANMYAQLGAGAGALLRSHFSKTPYFSDFFLNI